MRVTSTVQRKQYAESFFRRLFNTTTDTESLIPSDSELLYYASACTVTDRSLIRYAYLLLQSADCETSCARETLPRRSAEFTSTAACQY